MLLHVVRRGFQTAHMFSCALASEFPLLNPILVLILTCTCVCVHVHTGTLCQTF